MFGFCFLRFRGCGDAVHIPQLEEEDMSDCLCQYTDLITQDERCKSAFCKSVRKSRRQHLETTGCGPYHGPHALRDAREDRDAFFAEDGARLEKGRMLGTQQYDWAARL